MLIYSNANRGFIVNTESKSFGGIFLSYSAETMEENPKRPLYVIVNNEEKFIRMVEEKIYRKLLEDLKSHNILKPISFNLNVFDVIDEFGMSSVGLDLDLYLSYLEETEK